MKMKIKTIDMVIAIVFCLLIFHPSISAAHCDTLDGPVVKSAKIALEKGDVTPVLKWVQKEQEKEIQKAFKKTLSVRTKGPEAKELAEMYFFETVVRLHRAGEGAPYTGLKPTVSIDPIMVAADKSLETGKVDELVKQVNDEAAAGIRRRFDRVAEMKKHIDESVEAGREYVSAYVEFTHYVEGLYQEASGEDAHHHSPVHHNKSTDHHQSKTPNPEASNNMD
ncbi:MAG TPA: DUF6448 family protein [Thermodesulfobacteriota bacterium]|nr:DUF6448 family protein [Thermodesulfobacteriota bacterium]